MYLFIESYRRLLPQAPHVRVIFFFFFFHSIFPTKPDLGCHTAATVARPGSLNTPTTNSAEATAKRAEVNPYSGS